MDFGLSKEISHDVYKKAIIITNISIALEKYFKDKNYGAGVNSLTIGIICIRPKASSFFEERKRYIKSKKVLEYDVTIDHEKFKHGDENEIQGMVCTQILNSLSIISDLRIPDFDYHGFRQDLRSFFEEFIT